MNGNTQNRISKNRGRQRTGYTLIEMLAALIAASVLLASLAGTVVISTSLMETSPEQDIAWQEREITDRVAGDLRYATSFSDSGYGFQVTKPNVNTGASETASYDTYYDGLTRTVGSGATIVLDEKIQSHSFDVDGYSAAPALANDDVVRLRSTSSAFSSGNVSSINVDYPAGCKDGDLIVMAISARSPDSINVAPSGWNLLRSQSIGGLRLFTLIHTYSSFSPGPAQIDFTSGDATAAVVLACLENTDEYYGVAWTNTDSGWAIQGQPNTFPALLEATSGYKSNHLNLQVFAANGSPWHRGTLGLAAFSDAVQASSSGANASSVGIAVRNGATPSLSLTPRVWHGTTTSYLHVGIRLENTP